MSDARGTSTAQEANARMAENGHAVKEEEEERRNELPWVATNDDEK